MNILLIQREGVDLHHTLFLSETSRLVLRFYHPKKKPCGISVSCASLASGLSLISELRWYIRRYVRDVLFEVSPGIFCTHALAQDVYYERAAVLEPDWPFRKLYGFREGKLTSTVIMSPGSCLEDYHQEYIGVDRTIECWCTEEQMAEGEPEPLEDVSGEPGDELDS